MTCIHQECSSTGQTTDLIDFFSRLSLVPNPTTGLTIEPLDVTVLTKELNLMVLHKGIRTHQPVAKGWLVNLEKSELGHKQVFDFVGYQFNLRCGRVIGLAI